MFRRIIVGCLAGAACIVSGCGSDNDDSSGPLDVQVVDVGIEQSVLIVGEASVIDVEFSFDAGQVFDDGRTVDVLVLLPAGVAFREGSSEIDVVGGDDDDVGAQVLSCPTTGETYLLFSLDENDLDVAENPDGNADARLTLTVDAVAPTVTSIGARADEVAIFACGGPFVADAAVALQIQ